MTRKHPHYFKDVSRLQDIDVYRVLDLFQVTDQALGHAIKKLLVAGGRGAKDTRRDVQEAIDTLQRRVEMWSEDDTAEDQALADNRRADPGCTCPRFCAQEPGTVCAGLPRSRIHGG